ncbi:MAG TPA: hypothetical protein GXX19_04965 [Syntrophomonadaceae bacterium]|nr:hypothetical protein [Syntrophomonadaceae bacterium]
MEKVIPLVGYISSAAILISILKGKYSNALVWTVFAFCVAGTFQIAPVGNFGLSFGNAILVSAFTMTILSELAVRKAILHIFPRGDFRTISFVALVCLLCVYLCVGILRGNEFKYILYDLNQWSYFLLSVGLVNFWVLRLDRDEVLRAFDRISRAILVANVILVAVAVGGILQGHTVVDLGRLDPVALGQAYVHWGDFRPVRILTGTSYMLTVPIFYWATETLTAASRLRRLRCGFLAALGLILSQVGMNRSTILITVGTIFLWFIHIWMIKRCGRLLRLRIIVSIGIITLLLYVIFAMLGLSKWFWFYIAYGDKHRFAEAAAVWQILKASCLLGGGIGQSYTFWDAGRGEELVWFIPHLAFMWVPLQLGVSGTIVWWSYWVSGFLRVTKCVRLSQLAGSQRESAVFIGMLMGLISYLAQSIQSPLIFGAHSFLMQAVIFGLSARFLVLGNSCVLGGCLKSGSLPS